MDDAPKLLLKLAERLEREANAWAVAAGYALDVGKSSIGLQQAGFAADYFAQAAALRAQAAAPDTSWLTSPSGEVE